MCLTESLTHVFLLSLKVSEEVMLNGVRQTPRMNGSSLINEEA
jgi:hypothetical protein